MATSHTHMTCDQVTLDAVAFLLQGELDRVLEQLDACKSRNRAQHLAGVRDGLVLSINTVRSATEQR